MKKVLLTLSAVALASSVFAQGTVVFNNRVTGTLVTHVYQGGTAQVGGNGATDTPAGAFDWTAYTALVGAGYSAVLLAAPGSNIPLDQLVESATVTTFRTGTAAGQVAATTAVLTGVPLDAPVATLALAAWDNKGGTLNTWAAARTAWLANLTSAGVSPTFTLNAIGGTLNPTPNLVGLQSFNIYAVPEPSTFALAGLGAAALMIFRRRK